MAVFLVIGSGSFLAGCDSLFGVSCTTDVRANLVVEVRDAASGAPAARGATGAAAHSRSGVLTELFPDGGNELRLNANWSGERPGQYLVHVQKPGFKTEHVQTRVREDECHVITETVAVSLSRDPSAVELVPIAFDRGARAGGFPASAGIQVLHDTLVIAGMAAAYCGEVEITGFRVDDSWHIQLQPSSWASNCPGPQLQNFEARYRLEPGLNRILITHAPGWPVNLFGGTASARTTSITSAFDERLL